MNVAWYNGIVLIAIVGLGLIGGSIGLALKKEEESEWEIAGWSRRRETTARALDLGAIDRPAANVKDAVKEAEAVIVAAPVLAIREIFIQMAPHLPSGCVVTDTASTKVQVMKWAEQILPSSVHYVGGHPMAGKETYGIEAATADLFRGSTYCLTPSKKASPQSVDKVIRMVRRLGAEPLFIDAEEHDDLAAGISHLPMLLSAALVAVTARSPSWPQMSRLAATGYRDLTRLASGNPEINSHVCLSNREPIINWIDEFSQELERYRQLVAKGDGHLELALAESNRARQEWLNSLSR